MTEGGYNVGQRGGTTFGDDARYPKPTPDATSKLTIDMFKYMQGEVPILGKKVPDYYFSSMPWLIANYRIGVWQPPCEAQGPWITDFFNEVWGLNGELPLVQILKGLPKKIRHYGNPPKVWGVQRPSDALGTAWDESLTYVGIELAPCMNKDKPYWKLISAKRVENAGVVGIFVCCRDKNGNPIEGQSFFACRGEGNARVCDYAQTKGAVDGYWGNIPSFAMLGTYTTGVSKDKSQSNTDLVVGLGCGTETIGNAYIPTQFRLEFQYTEPSGTNVVGIDGRILDAANTAFKALGAASDIIHNIMFAEKE